MKKKLDLNKSIKKFYFFYHRIKTKFWYGMIFGEIGNKSIVIKPMKLDNPMYISLGKSVIINEYSWLYCDSNPSNSAKIVIDDGAQIGHFFHVVAMEKIYIGRNVLIANKVFISDNNHSYKNIKIPIMYQGLNFKNNVHIGEGSWIGENVTIVGAKIGRNSIIGSNSVVMNDVDDYSIAVGSPARTIKKFSFEKNEWINV